MTESLVCVGRVRVAGVPVVLDVRFWFPVPKSYMRKRRPVPEAPHTSKPDLDNLLKLVKDALNGVAWSDDAQVVRYRRAEKRRCAQEDNRPRTEISVLCQQESERA